VNCDSLSLDILKNSFVSGRFPAGIVIGLQAVNRNDEVKSPDLVPFCWYRSYRACYKLNVNSHFAKAWKQDAQLAKPDKWLASYDGKMEGAVLAHKAQETINQFLAFEIGEGS
jgi:hypothetical protein